MYNRITTTYVATNSVRHLTSFRRSVLGRIDASDSEYVFIFRHIPRSSSKKQQQKQIRDSLTNNLSIRDEQLFVSISAEHYCIRYEEGSHWLPWFIVLGTYVSTNCTRHLTNERTYSRFLFSTFERLALGGGGGIRIYQNQMS